MKRIFLILIATLALTGCDPSADEQAHMREVLPPGCTISDLGSYGDIDHVITVICDGRRTQTQSYEERHGKSHRDISSVEIEN
jgi:hypothetical protein